MLQVKRPACSREQAACSDGQLRPRLGMINGDHKLPSQDLIDTGLEVQARADTLLAHGLQLSRGTDCGGLVMLHGCSAAAPQSRQPQPRANLAHMTGISSTSDWKAGFIQPS